MPVKKSVKKVSTRRVVGGRVSVEPKMVSFGTAVCNFFKKFFQFSGVATRAEYWWTVLFLLIVFFGLSFILAVFSVFLEFVATDIDMLVLATLVATGLLIIAMFVFLIPIFALTARRLHDAGFSAKVLWLYLVLWGLSMCAYSFGFSESLVFLLLYWLVSLGLGIFVFVVSLSPSKVRGNPYRD